jgi:hypothetical protein
MSKQEKRGFFDWVRYFNEKAKIVRMQEPVIPKKRTARPIGFSPFAMGTGKTFPSVHSFHQSLYNRSSSGL